MCASGDKPGAVPLVADICQPCSPALSLKKNEPVTRAIELLTANPERHMIYVLDDWRKVAGQVGPAEIMDWLRVRLGAGADGWGNSISDSLGAERLAQACHISEIMTAAATIKVNDSLPRALAVMAQSHTTELAVVSESGILIGQVGLPRLLSRIIKDVPGATECHG